MALTAGQLRGNGSRNQRATENEVAKPEWGLKRACQNCTPRFYDLRQDPIICPACGAKFDPLAMLRPRRGRAAAAIVQETKAPVAAAPTEDAGVGVEIDNDVAEDVEDEDSLESVESDDEEDEDVIEDASELGEDGDDMSKVIEGVDNGED